MEKLNVFTLLGLQLQIKVNFTNSKVLILIVILTMNVFKIYKFCVYYRYKAQKSMYQNFHDTYQWSFSERSDGNPKKEKERSSDIQN